MRTSTIVVWLGATLAACGGSSDAGHDSGGNGDSGGGGSGITGPAPTVGGCSALAGAAFCLDFDGSGDDVSPFGWAAASPAGTFIMPSVTTTDGNASFTMSETGTDMGVGVSPQVELGSGSDVTLQLDLRSAIATTTRTEVVFLELAAGSTTLGEVFVVVDADGTLEIGGDQAHQVFAPMPTTGALAAGEWASVALHATMSQNAITVSAEAGAVGGARAPIFPATRLALAFTPDAVSAEAGVFPGEARPVTFQFDDVALTLP